MRRYASCRTERALQCDYPDKQCFGDYNMTITSRCNHPGPLAKLIPTVSVTSLLARLLRKR
jgi:hypothetical protein